MEPETFAAILAFAGILITGLVALYAGERRLRRKVLDNPGHGPREEYADLPSGGVSVGLFYREFDRLHTELTGLRDDVQKLTAAIKEAR